MKTALCLILVLVIAFSAAVVVVASEVKITANDAAEGDRFGYSVSISGDYAIIGAGWDDDAGDDSGSAQAKEINPILSK